MTRKQKRGLLIGLGLGGLGIAIGLVLFALQDSIVFFYTPSELAQKGVKPGQRIRLGGLVEKGSVRKSVSATVEFAVTDTVKSIAVRYQGVLPDLFREEQGVVAEGSIGPDGAFAADSVLAKHDENYMPPEVAKALKAKGVWKESGGKAPAATN
jgi:cytochrome c-type biogenesis protein CcmE